MGRLTEAAKGGTRETLRQDRTKRLRLRIERGARLAILAFRALLDSIV
jgi:hypothetical protein